MKTLITFGHVTFDNRLKSIRYYASDSINYDFIRIIYYVITEDNEVIIISCIDHDYDKALKRFWKYFGSPQK